VDRLESTDKSPEIAAIPLVLTCLELGLGTDVRASHTVLLCSTYSATRDVTDFPVSRADEIRLFAKMSGWTSTKMWFVARRRRTRAEYHVSKTSLYYIFAAARPSFDESMLEGRAISLIWSP
jgi:hypothetical protein